VRKFYSTNSLLAICAAAVTFCTGASAQDPNSVQDLANMSLEQLMDIKVTTVSKIPVSVKSAPTNVDIITRDDIKRYGYRSVAEALRQVVGMNVYATQYQFSFVRGFAIPGDFNTRILLLVDGHKINDGNYGQAYIGDEFPGDIENVERIEVSKGPGSAVWGTNAMLAVVNVVTRKGSKVGGAESVASYGSNGRSKIFETVGGKTDGGLEYSLTSSYLNDNGFSHIHFPAADQPGGELISDFSDQQFAYHGGANFDYKDVHLSVFHSVRKTQLPYAFGTTFNDGGNAYNDNSTRIDLSLDRVIDQTDNKRIFTRVFYDRWNYDADYVIGDVRTLNHDKSYGSLIGAEIRYSQDLASWVSILAGAEFDDMYKLSILNYDRDPQSENYITAVDPFEQQSYYAEAHFHAATDLELVGGVRGDIYSTQDDSITPRASIIYSPFESSTLRLMYGNGFRVANNNERNYADGQFQIANRDLKPEKVRTFELSWQQRLEESLQATLSLFHYRFTDLISLNSLDSGQIQFQNGSSDTISKGIELSVLSKLPGGFSAYAGSTLLNTETEGGRIPASPRFMADAGLSFPFFDQRLFISPELRYISSLKPLREGADDVSGYIAANLQILAVPLKSNWDISAGIYNIFDKKYYLPAPPAPFVNYDEITQPRRTFQLQTRVKF